MKNPDWEVKKVVEVDFPLNSGMALWNAPLRTVALGRVQLGWYSSRGRKTHWVPQRLEGPAIGCCLVEIWHDLVIYLHFAFNLEEWWHLPNFEKIMTDSEEDKIFYVGQVFHQRSTEKSVSATKELLEIDYSRSFVLVPWKWRLLDCLKSHPQRY